MNDEPIAELVLEQMAVGDAGSLRVQWLMDGYPPVGTKLYTHPAKTLTIDDISIDEILEIATACGIKRQDTIMLVDFVHQILKRVSVK